MAALTRARRNAPKTLTAVRLPLANGVKVFEGGLACLDLSDGSLKKGAAGATLLPIGHFRGIPEDGITGDGTKTVEVQLPREIVCYWYANAPSPHALEASDVGSFAYIMDDQTATSDDSGNSVLGRVWAVHPTLGVLIELAVSLGPAGPEGSPA